ncbi:MULTISPECIES: hypothetical protein [Ralstonia]|uniref:hypothetical protein n=1 Tax=Ralstonia TaxID=48736 RepID=UPI000A9A5CAD|nr:MULTISPECIES: hypothetical protein [Ralstonia]PLT15980.1 hypothetical protein CXP34_17530 [Ralstonia mannitolilytica]
MNRRLFLCASALPLFGLGGCATNALYDELSKRRYKSYEEPVNQILVSSDGKKIVVLGVDYHYIFDTPPKLIEILDSPLHPKLSAEMRQFEVTPDAEIKGWFFLKMPTESSDDDLKLAKSYGFEVASSSQPHLNFDLSGKRYSAKGFKAPEGLTKKLNQSYSVDVREELPLGGKAALVLLTPVTVAADGAVVLLTIALFPLTVISRSL